MIFFAYIGFDAVSTAAQEAKKPQRDMPMGILGSLAICTVLYVLFAWALTGIVHYTVFKGDAAPVAPVISRNMPYSWLQIAIILGIVAGYSSVHSGHVAGSITSFLLHVARRPAAATGSATCIHVPHPLAFQTFVCGLVVATFQRLFPINFRTRGNGEHRHAAGVCYCVHRHHVYAQDGPDLTRPFKRPWCPFTPRMGMISAFP